MIYDIGDPCSKVFILKSGKVSVESFIEIDSQNTYPTVRVVLGKVLGDEELGDEDGQETDAVQG